MVIYAVLGVMVLWVIWTFNSLVRLRNRSEEAWSDIEVQFKRRYDLIPNLIEAVKGYMAHERGTLQEVTEARTRAMEVSNVLERAGAENTLSNTLKTLFAVSENYPNLKANANFLDLQRELADTENKIQAARRFFNSVVLELNTRIDIFPSNLIARLFRFVGREFFDLEGEEEKAAKEPVKVKF